MDIKIKIGKRIKELRNHEGITQMELAYRSDIDRTYITGVENGKRNISIVNLEKIALALNVNLTIFFKSDLFV